MLKIAVVDDSAVYLASISKMVSDIFEENNISFELTKFSLGNDFLSSNEKENYTVVFLDIILPDVRGFDVIEKLRETRSNTFVIFITTENSLVYEGYDYRPFNFVVKADEDLMKNRLQQIVKKLLRHIKQFQLITLELPHGERIEIESNQIVYISSDKNYLTYHIKNIKPVFIRQKISEAEAQLSEYGFFRVHKKYIINWNNVHEINLDFFEVIMTTGDKIPFNNSLRKSIEQEYLLYLRSLR